MEIYPIKVYSGSNGIMQIFKMGKITGENIFVSSHLVLDLLTVRARVEVFNSQLRFRFLPRYLYTPNLIESKCRINHPSGKRHLQYFPMYPILTAITPALLTIEYGSQTTLSWFILSPRILGHSATLAGVHKRHSVHVWFGLTSEHKSPLKTGLAGPRSV